jgi:hypothetical protein
MIRFSIIVLVLGLQYNRMTLGLGAQTNPPGPDLAGESFAWWLSLTGLLF